MGITLVKQPFMAFIQYFSQAKSESLINSFGHLLENYGMIIPNRFEHSKQLYAEFRSSNNNYFSKVNVLISWVNQTQKECSIEIWSDEPFAKKKHIVKKYTMKLVKSLNLSICPLIMHY
tara:strand:- start:447 stop:803 length:357 start_codon:yes stop_codon:yes gene_type:complete